MSQYNKHMLYSCRVCGSKFSPHATGGICPYCHNTTQDLINMQRSNFKKEQRRKNMIRRALLRLSVIVAIFLIAVITVITAAVNIIKSNESLIFASASNDNSPVFYNDSDDLLYFLAKNKPILIGKGTVDNFCHSDNGKSVFFVFEGTRDIDSVTTGGSTLFKISQNGKDISAIAESSYGTISFIQGGNCKYVYYMINETIGTYQSSARLYIYNNDSGNSKKICEYSSSGSENIFRVSPNGRYLIYKAEEDNGTKLMKFSVKDGTSIPLGIKNAEPVSIDNKGKYYSYIKTNDDGLADFYLESEVANRQKTQLETATADRILVSADGRSFVIETGNLTTIKTNSCEPIVIATRTGSGIGLDIIKNLTTHDLHGLIPSRVHTIEHCTNKSFFPYFYTVADNTSTKLFTCDKNGEKKELTDVHFTDFVTNGTKAAFISENALYTIELNVKNSTITTLSENFANYDLEFIPENGKFIFYSDNDGNLYRIPFDFNGSDWTKVAIDASDIIASKDGKTLIYHTDNSVYCTKGATAYNICANANLDNTYVLDNCSAVYICAQSEESKADNAYSLYKYDGKNLQQIANNVTSLSAYEYTNILHDETVYSSYVERVHSDVLSQTDQIADNNVSPSATITNNNQ